MKTVAMFLIAVSVFSRACESLQGPKTPKEDAAGFGTSSAKDLIIESQQENIPIEWGVPTEIPVNVRWAKGQKYAVQIAPAENTPPWLSVETRPVILDPPGTMNLIVQADMGGATLGKHKIKFEASAYGLSNPVTFEQEITIRRHDGTFDPVLPAQQTLECRNICGKVVNGRLVFYDIVKEKGQSCGDAMIPESQRIGATSYALSNKGYGYGRTCKVAGVYESSGSFSIVNLGYYTHRVPRGSILMSVSGADNCWLSADNTIAVVQYGSSVMPYDVLTGNPLGEQQRMSEKITSANYENGTLNVFGSAFASQHPTWTIK